MGVHVQGETFEHTGRLQLKERGVGVHRLRTVFGGFTPKNPGQDRVAPPES